MVLNCWSFHHVILWLPRDLLKVLPNLQPWKYWCVSDKSFTLQQDHNGYFYQDLSRQNILTNDGMRNISLLCQLTLLSLAETSISDEGLLLLASGMNWYYSMKRVCVFINICIYLLSIGLLAGFLPQLDWLVLSSCPNVKSISSIFSLLDGLPALSKLYLSGTIS